MTNVKPESFLHPLVRCLKPYRSLCPTPIARIHQATNMVCNSLIRRVIIIFRLGNFTPAVDYLLRWRFYVLITCFDLARLDQIGRSEPWKESFRTYPANCWSVGPFDTECSVISSNSTVYITRTFSFCHHRASIWNHSPAIDMFRVSNGDKWFARFPYHRGCELSRGVPQISP